MTSETQLAHARILIVDDSRMVRAGLKKNLSEEFDLVEAADGEQGWQMLLADDAIQLMISDLSMPELDGYGLVERIRASEHERVKRTPVIIISGEEDEEAKAKAVRLGANDFITKSTNRVELISRVNTLLQAARNAHALAVSRAALEQSATTDPVTGLATRHLLLVHGKQAFAQAQRYQTQVSSVVFELDHFAGVLEKYGQAVADQMLVLLGKLVASKLRKEDTLSRLGGASFAVLAPNSDAEQAKMLAERLRASIAAAKINFRGSVIRLQASIGVSNNARDLPESVEELLDHATRRMEAARGEGGNRVHVEDWADIIPESVTPDLNRALAMVRGGRVESLRAHAPEVLARLFPLLEALDGQLGLGLPLAQIKARAAPPELPAR